MLLFNQEFWNGFIDALVVCSVLSGIVYFLKFRKQKQQQNKT